MQNPSPPQQQIPGLTQLSRMITDPEDLDSLVSALQNMGIHDPVKQEELKTAVVIRHRYKLGSIMARLFRPMSQTMKYPYARPGEINRILAQVSQGILPLMEKNILILSEHLINHPSSGTPEIRDHVASWWAKGRRWEGEGCTVKMTKEITDFPKEIISLAEVFKKRNKMHHRGKTIDVLIRLDEIGRSNDGGKREH